MFHISLNSYTPFFLKKQEYQISASQIYSNLLTDTSYATLFCASSPSNFFTYSRRKSGISAPADAWDIVRFSIRPVHCDQHICNLSSKRCFPVNRCFAYIAIQKNLICLCFIGLFFHKADFSCKYRKYQTVSLFFMPVV